MTRYENLVVYAKSIGANVEEMDFGIDKKCGRCIGNYIFINNRMTQCEKYEILSEEIGHYKTTFGDITNQNNIINLKSENLARRESYKIIAKPGKIVNAIKNGARTSYEIADYLNVTIETLFDVIDDLKRQYGIRILIDNYYLYLEPHLDIAFNKTSLRDTNSCLNSFVL